MTYKNRVKGLLAFLIAILTIASTSCESDEEDAQIAVSVSGIENKSEVRAGDILQIKVFAQTTSKSLARLKVSAYDKEKGQQTVTDIAISGTIYDDYVYYHTPYLEAERAEIVLSFTVSDNTGYSRTIERTIYAIRRDEPLEERSGIVLYCDDDMDTKPDGYCFSEMRPVTVGLVDDYLVDFYIPAVTEIDLPDPLDAPTIVRQWWSKTDINFARSSNFDFSKASSENISSAYESSIRAPRITNLRSGDIVLVGRGSKPLGVIQIVDMIDGGRLTESRYILNIKAIKSALPYERPEETVPPSEVTP